MLSSVSCSSSDLSFFSPSKTAKSGASTASSVTVTTRVACRAIKSTHEETTSLPRLPASSQSTTRPFLPTNTPKKRKSLPFEQTPPVSPNLPRAVKRLRSSVPTSGRRASSSRTSSRASSRRPSSLEPIYRSDRSRSASIFTSNHSHAPLCNRRWATDEDGTPGMQHLSSEEVVLKLIKSYKPCWYFFFLSTKLLNFSQILLILTTPTTSHSNPIQIAILSLNWSTQITEHPKGLFTF